MSINQQDRGLPIVDLLQKRKRTFHMDDIDPKKPDKERKIYLTPEQMIQAFGKWTCVQLAEALRNSQVICCGKRHEKENTNYDSCDLLGSNLVCGHPTAYKNIFLKPLRTAVGAIATAAYVTDHFSEKPISNLYIPALRKIAISLHKLDGASFVAFGKLSSHPPTHTNVPLDWRSPELEKITNVDDLTLEIMVREEAIGPIIKAIRDDVLVHFEEALGRHVV